MDWWKEISPNFDKDEIFSTDLIKRSAWHIVDIEALAKLNKLRDILDAPCFVNHRGLTMRGVVSPREALLRGGASLTMHVTGKAFDVSCYTKTIDDVVKTAKDAGFTFVIPYKSWVHVDTRNPL